MLSGEPRNPGNIAAHWRSWPLRRQMAYRDRYADDADRREAGGERTDNPAPLEDRAVAAPGAARKAAPDGREGRSFDDHEGTGHEQQTCNESVARREDQERARQSQCEGCENAPVQQPVDRTSVSNHGAGSVASVRVQSVTLAQGSAYSPLTRDLR
jgi:hypothetical protein